ncbi:MAG: TatD family hydrolase [Deltaproteobacteria bacterium]|nr:TatD family hydrolase [Deltaproteobacteria bacterium]MBW2661060.1 TatD family hydrolase [Deltaproteobacteria bacterium]
MKLFDTHCHLNDEVYDKDIDAVIERARDAGVAACMVVGTDKASSIKAAAMAESINDIYASVGIHPHETQGCSELILKSLLKLTENPKVCAWGEIGLDFNRMHSPKGDQEKWFIRQLEFADRCNLPVIFHERDSNGRLLEIVRANYKKNEKAVVHCFSGNREELEQYINLGFYIGITGILTLKKRGADLRELVPIIPVEQIIVETDAPYLTPAPEKNRTRRNEPAFVRSILFKLAEARKEDPEYLAFTTWGNSRRLFNIPL